MSALESESNNNGFQKSSGKCSQKECAVQKGKLLKIILSELKMLRSEIRDDPNTSFIKEVCDMIILLLVEEKLLKRFDNASFKPEDGKWYIDQKVQTLEMEKQISRQELKEQKEEQIQAQQAYYKQTVAKYDSKFSKYKEHACNRCRQIADEIDRLDNQTDDNVVNVTDVTNVNKPKAVPDNQIPPKINNPITPVKDSPKVIDKTAKIPEKIPPKTLEAKSTSIETPRMTAAKLNDKPKPTDKPMVVPHFPNIPPPQPHLSKNQDAKKISNTVGNHTKQVVQEKVPNVRIQSNQTQPHLPKSVSNPATEGKTTDAKNSTIRKHPRKNIVTPPVVVSIRDMRAVKIYDKEIANSQTNNVKSKGDGAVNTSTSSKVDQSSVKPATSVSNVHHTNNNSLPSYPQTKPAPSSDTGYTRDEDIDILSSGDERTGSNPPKKKRKRFQRAPVRAPVNIKPADNDSDSSVSTTIGDTGDSEEGNNFNLIQPDSTDSDESDDTTDCHDRSTSEFDLMRDKWDGYIFQSDSDEENNLIEKEKQATEYRKHDMGKYWIHPNSPGPLSGLKFVNNVLHRPKKIQQFWYFVPAPGERVRPKWVELDQENLAVKWGEAQNMPRERLQKHLQKLCPTSAINLDILDEQFDEQANDVAFLIADKFSEEEKSIAESDFYKLLYRSKSHSNEDINVFDPKKGVATLIYDKRGDITYKQSKS